MKSVNCFRTAVRPACNAGRGPRRRRQGGARQAQAEGFSDRPDRVHGGLSRRRRHGRHCAIARQVRRKVEWRQDCRQQSHRRRRNGRSRLSRHAGEARRIHRRRHRKPDVGRRDAARARPLGLHRSRADRLLEFRSVDLGRADRWALQGHVGQADRPDRQGQAQHGSRRDRSRQHVGLHPRSGRGELRCKVPARAVPGRRRRHQRAGRRQRRHRAGVLLRIPRFGGRRQGRCPLASRPRSD